MNRFTSLKIFLIYLYLLMQGMLCASSAIFSDDKLNNKLEKINTYDLVFEKSPDSVRFIIPYEEFFISHDGDVNFENTKKIT